MHYRHPGPLSSAIASGYAANACLTGSALDTPADVQRSVMVLATGYLQNASDL